jgi:hypothetical protein
MLFRLREDGEGALGGAVRPQAPSNVGHMRKIVGTGIGGCQMTTPSFIVRAKKIRFQVGKIGLVLVGETAIADPRRRIRCLFTWTATTR